MNLANAVGDLMGKVQAGPLGQPGILTFMSAVMGSSLGSAQPAAGPDWVPQMVNAWQSAMMSSVITPGTVKFPGWTASQSDILTIPSAAASIPTLAAAAALLQTELMALAATYMNPQADTATLMSGPQKMAQAFRDATSMFLFQCIGLMILPPPAPPAPLPQPYSAL